MAYRPKGMGLDRELERKIAEKYSNDDAVEIVEWILNVLGCGEDDTDIQPPDGYPEDVGKESFEEWLRDGVILCKLINNLTHTTKCKPNNTSRIRLVAMKKSKEMENIGMFLKATEEYGVSTIDLFQTVSLYEGKNIPQVMVTMYKLGATAQKNGYDGPVIGVKPSEENKRSFEEQKLREGRAIIGLQMGTNQVASQQGMTPYGLGRQLVSKSTY